MESEKKDYLYELEEQCFFRYRSFNENTLKEIINTEIWHSKSEFLNDPFEFPFSFNWEELNIDNLPSIYRTIFPYDSDDFLIATYLDGLESELLDSLIRYYKNTVDSLLEYHRKAFVACFCKEFKDALMWSHYSDGMRGICIAYDKRSFEESTEYAVPDAVEYNSHVKQISYNDFRYTTEHFTDGHPFLFTKNWDIPSSAAGVIKTDLTLWVSHLGHLFQKHNRWSYEREYRHVLLPEEHEENAFGIALPLPEQAIKGIIFGSKIEPTNLKLLQMICKQRGIKMFKASPQLSDYSVHVEPYNYDSSQP